MIVQPEPCKYCRFAETWYHEQGEYMFTYSCAAGIPYDGKELNMNVCTFKTHNKDICKPWAGTSRIKIERG